MLALHLAEAGERGLDAELLQVGRVDRTHERLDQPVEDLASQAAAHEAGHALVGVVHPRRDEVFQGRTQLAQRAEDRRRGQRPEARGGHHQEAVGQGVQPSFSHDEGAAEGRVGLDEPIAQPEAPAQIEPPGHGGDEVVGALLDLETLLVDGPEDAAQSRAAFQKDKLTMRGQLDQPVRGGQTGNAPADHGDPAGSGGWLVANGHTETAAGPDGASLRSGDRFAPDCQV